MNGKIETARLFVGFRFALAATAFSVLGGILVFAGGPNDPLTPGVYLRWEPSQPVSFVIDNGPLRDSPTGGLSRDQGAELVREVFQTWEDVEHATISFEDAGFLMEDIDETSANLFSPNQRGITVVFDDDGAIVEEIFPGQRQFVLGFAIAFPATPRDLFYSFGVAVLNGLQANLSPFGSFRKTILHEVGHALGLDHTQAGLDAYNRNAFASVPIMYPVVAPGGGAEPRNDEIAWISFLYPEESFRGSLGAIKGTVRRSSGVPFQGVNVVAVPVNVSPQGAIEELAGQVGCVSDFLINWDGSYELPGLAPGDYVVFIEPLDAFFTGGSGVGPFDLRFANFPKDYYNGAGESAVDDPQQRTVIRVGAGEVVSGVNFVSNDPVDAIPGNDLGSLADDDTHNFIFFPMNFTFPFFGRVHKGVWVNSDGNLTFDEGDFSSFPRSEGRFLGRVPRIAPLFTDLNVEQGGTISTEFDGNGFTIRWDGVPEFGPSAGVNTFSVTLFRNGDIRFQYDEISVTPDDSTDPVTAIVGVSPGLVPPRGQTSLLDDESPFPMEELPVYQVFLGAVSPKDLEGRQIVFEAARSQFFLYFPLNQAGATSFTGFAVTNDAADGSILLVEGLTADGQLQPYPDNPHAEELDGGQQLARIGSDFFALPIGESQDGWVRIGSTGVGLASFFQFGNGLGGTVTRLDGSTASTELSNTLYFTRLYDGAGSFPATAGPQTAETVIAVANPNDLGITLALRLFDAMGNQIGATVERVLPANGCLRESLSSLFGAGVISDGFVMADVSGPGAVGFELVELEDTLLGFNASPGNDQLVSYSAQLANGNAGGISIFTSLKLVNVSGASRTILITPLAEDGAILAGAFEVTLGPNQTFQRDLGELFGLGPADGPSSAGSLRVEADGPGVIGDVVFGDPQSIRYAAALPLQSRLLRRAIFSQVANAPGNSLAARTFTGLAFHNPGGQTADISVRVFQADGTETGSAMIGLPSGNRISTVLEVLIPSTAGQTGGFIVIESTQPVVAQQLFGNFSLDFLSAVPPTVFN